ncbi:hypothetical protein [Agrobacterium tumefaciens]|uniref:hypothetical protein n=1 Tax=Agrobacterium tumefaciens TaxID=358 RepID=UPI002869F8B2|nr:hypothetical protein [Agrobacterium tumefaciens]
MPDDLGFNAPVLPVDNCDVVHEIAKRNMNFRIGNAIKRCQALRQSVDRVFVSSDRGRVQFNDRSGRDGGQLFLQGIFLSFQRAVLRLHRFDRQDASRHRLHQPIKLPANICNASLDRRSLSHG